MLLAQKAIKAIFGFNLFAIVVPGRPHNKRVGTITDLEILRLTQDVGSNYIDNKKLCYGKGTERRAMLVNSCYVSGTVRVLQVPYSQSDRLGHWQWCYSINHMRFPISLRCYYVSILHRFPDITYFPNFKEVTWLQTSLLGTIIQQTKFEKSSFTNCKDLIGAKFKKTSHVIMTTPLLELFIYLV